MLRAVFAALALCSFVAVTSVPVVAQAATKTETVQKKPVKKTIKKKVRATRTHKTTKPQTVRPTA